MKSNPHLVAFLTAIGLLLSSCNYDFPLTAKPTQKIDSRLLGDWVAVDKDNQKEMLMLVREQDDSTYLVVLDDDNYRGVHTDFANTAFISVQPMNPSNRKYVYFSWRLTPKGDQLTLRPVSTAVVPETTRSAVEAQRIIKDNLFNPKLFGEALTFTKKNAVAR